MMRQALRTAMVAVALSHVWIAGAAAQAGSVAPRAKLKVPAWLPLLWMFPMILRYSIPNFSVWGPCVHVTMSLMMNVGRVVTLPTLMPALLP